MVRVSSPAKLRPWSELTAIMVMGVVPGLVINGLNEFQTQTPHFLNAGDLNASLALREDTIDRKKQSQRVFFDSTKLDV